MAQVFGPAIDRDGCDSAYLNPEAIRPILGRSLGDVLDHLCTCLTDIFDIEHSTSLLQTGDRRHREDRSHA